jgi:hypothetical protein
MVYLHDLAMPYRWYLNGAPAGATAADSLSGFVSADLIQPASARLRIRQSSDNPGATPNGSVAEFRMFDGALTQQEIRLSMMSEQMPIALMGRTIADLPLDGVRVSPAWDLGPKRLGAFSAVGTVTAGFDPPQRGAPNVPALIRSIASIASAAPATIVSDTFTGTDATAIASHAPDTGGTWVEKQAGLKLLSNKLEAVDFGDCRAYNTATPGSADYEVSVNVTLNQTGWGNKAGVRGREVVDGVLPIQNCYEAYFNESTHTWYLDRWNGGTPTNLGTYADATFNAVGITRALKLGLVGSVITVYVDGVSRIAVTDATPLTAAGLVGIMNAGGIHDGLLLDNYLAAPATVPSTVTVDLAASPSTARALTVAPTAVLATVAVSPALDTARAITVDPAVVITGGTTVVDLAASPTTARALTVDPTALLSTVTITPAADTARAITVAPTAVLGTVTVAPAVDTARALTVDPSIYTGPPLGAVTLLDHATLGQMPGASGGMGQNHLIYAANTARWWFFTLNGAPIYTGTATGGTTGGLDDSTKAWTTGALVGAVVIFTGGPGAGQIAHIGSNTATHLTFYDNAGDITLPVAPAAGSTTYKILDTRYLKAYVSSGADLKTATWAAATNSNSPVIHNSTGFDRLGGVDQGVSGKGSVPDGRTWAVGYASIGGVDVVQILNQQNAHYMHETIRARLGVGSPSTIVWDTVGPTSGWTDGMPGNECAPSTPQGLSLAISTTNRWHGLNEQNGVELCGMPATTIDDATANRNPTWGGSRLSFDTALATPDAGGQVDGVAWQSAMAPLASGIMLAVYTNGSQDRDGSDFWPLIGPDSIHQYGLRFVKSTSESAWPTTNVGAAIPSLGTARNDPNDWGMVGRTTTDVHLIRRESATVLQHVRYNGTTWTNAVGAAGVTTLPTGGLTGHAARGGVHLASDGTYVWAFVVDTDANNTVKYLRWDATGGWATTWQSVSTNTSPKMFLTGLSKPATNNQIGLIWTEGPDSSNQYTVQAVAFDAAANVLVDLSASPDTAKGATVAPVVVQSSLTADLASAPNTARAITVNPTAILATVTINLAASPTTAKGATVDPVVSLGSVVVSPAVNTARAITVAPTAVLGTVTVSPSIDTVRAITVDPTAILATVSVSPAPATARALTVDPTVSVFGGGTVVDLAASPSTARALTVAPTAVLATVAVSPSVDTARAITVAPAAVLGTVAVSPAIDTARAFTVDPAVIVFGGGTIVDLSASPTTAKGVTVAPVVGLTTVAVDLTSSPATGRSVTVAPVIGLSSVAVSLTPATAVAAALNAAGVLATVAIIPTVRTVSASTGPAPAVVLTSISVVPATITAAGLAVGPIIVQTSLTVVLASPVVARTAVVAPVILVVSAMSQRLVSPMLVMLSDTGERFATLDGDGSTSATVPS